MVADVALPKSIVRRAVGRLRSLSVGRKLTLIYVLGVILPLALANGLVLRRVVLDTAVQERQFLVTLVENASNAIEREFEPISFVAESVYADAGIYRSLGRRYDRFEDFIHVHRETLMPSLTRYVSVFPSITRMIIYTDNPILRVAEGYLSLDEFARDTGWYQTLRAPTSQIRALVHEDADPRLVIEPQTHLSVFRVLESPLSVQSGELVLRIDVNRQTLTRVLSQADFLGRVEVVDGEGETVTSFTSAVEPDAPMEFDLPVSTQALLSGWRIRGSIGASESAPAWSTRWSMLFAVSGMSVAVTSLFILLLSRSLTLRLNSLSNQMRRVEREDFSPVKMSEFGRDEIDHLIDDYNIMAARIDALINSGYKLEIAQQQSLVARKQAELDALQSQVNPHFLYNVLESIRMKSHMKGEHETAAIVKRLSRSLRRITSWHEDMVTLGEELAFTQEYLEIQRYRFGDRLSWTVSCEPEAEAVRIPKMTVQGLVENACIHGIEGTRDGGEVRVDATVATTDVTESLRLTVHDTGVGCESEAVRSLLQPGRSESRHVGISNIWQRLRLHFGSRFEFDFQSIPGRGTTVTISIEVSNGTESAHG